MSALKGTEQGRALMAHIRSHKKPRPAAAAKPDAEDAADVASEPGGEPAAENESTAAVTFMNKRRKAAASKKSGG
jgi:hypothetical protein